MGSAVIGKPPSSEYVRLYHLTTASHAINNIAMGRMKVARFSDVNDPFELMALNMKYGNVRKVVGDFKEKVNNQFGILCFSEDWTSPVMWSHYAEKHTSICLGFDVIRTSVQKIDYADKRILEELGASDEPYGLSPELQNTLLHTKCHEWKYEEEYRKVVSLPDAIKEGNLYFWSFGHDIHLAEVIIGQYCNLSLGDVRNLVDKHYPQTNTFKARLAFKYFKVVPNITTVL
jgi:hypothetical protein